MKTRTQEVIQGNINGSDEDDDASGHVKQTLGLEVLPGDVIESIGG